MIIDASVAFKLVVDEPDSALAIDLASRHDLVGPTLLQVEVANALWKRVRKGELLGGDEIEDRIRDVARYIRRVDETPLIPRALSLGIKLAHPVYDCIYLALAEDEDDELVTADRRFAEAVRGTEHQERVRELGR